VTDEEIALYGKELSDLTDKCSDSNPESSIREDLKKLARKVGASTCTHYTANDRHMTGDADTSEIIRNIHQALQTASMANMCRTATQGYEIATKASNSASRQFRIIAIIAFFSAVAACVSAVAAWVAAMRA